MSNIKIKTCFKTTDDMVWDTEPEATDHQNRLDIEAFIKGFNIDDELDIPSFMHMLEGRGERGQYHKEIFWSMLKELGWA